VPYCQKYTPRDCFFGYFAHCVEITRSDIEFSPFCEAIMNEAPED